MDNKAVSPVRLPWVVFGLVLAAGLVGFALSVDWSAQSWLDIAAVFVSVAGIAAVFLYASGRNGGGGRFWRLFRWVFTGVVTLQSFVHATAVAKNRGFTTAGTIAFVVAMAVLIGWIYALQWLAMSRLADRT